MTGLCTKARARKIGSWETGVLTVASAWAGGEPIRRHHVPLEGLRYQAQGLFCRGGESLNPEQDHETHLPHHRPRWVLRPPTNPACCGQPAKADKSYKEPQGIPCLDAFRPSHIHFPDGRAGPEDAAPSFSCPKETQLRGLRREGSRPAGAHHAPPFSL